MHAAFVLKHGYARTALHANSVSNLKPQKLTLGEHIDGDNIDPLCLRLAANPE
jgi:hypothetical protein